MKKSSLRKLGLVIAVVFLLIQMAACQTPTEKTETTTQQTQATTTAQQTQATTTAKTETVKTEPQNLNKTGFPIVKQPVTLKFAAGQDPAHADFAKMTVFMEYEKMTNVKIQWDLIPRANLAERKNIIFATGDLPDAFYRCAVTAEELARYGGTKDLVPLNDLIYNYSENLKKHFKEQPDVPLAVTSPDGGIYSLPLIVSSAAARTVNKMWINQKWLNNLGLSMPNTHTEFLDVMKAFRDGDPDKNGVKDSIPMTGQTGSVGQGYKYADFINVFPGMFGLNLQFFIGSHMSVDEGNKVNLFFNDDKYKKMLIFLNQMWKEGYLDKEAFSQDGTQMTAKIKLGIVGLYTVQVIDVKDFDTWSILPPFKGPDGDRMVTPSLPVVRDIGTFAITKANKNPEVTIRWIDYFYGDEGSVFFRFGGKKEFYTLREDGKPDYLKEWYADPRGIGAVVAQYTPWVGGITPHWINDRNSIAVVNDSMNKAQKAIDPYMPKVSYQKPILEPKVQESINILTNDLFTYGLEMQYKFITGAVSFDKWADYVRVIEKIGLKEYEDIYQKAFDKVIGK